MRLYNSLTRQTEPFEPSGDHTVGLYVCGPTVYDHIHIGNVRPILVFDVLRRYFERYKGWSVTHVQNVTDVDDKLIQRSAETGEPVDRLAARYTEAYFDLLKNLHVLPPTHSPRATEHVPGMVQMVKALIDRGFAYEANGDVYFRVNALASYGQLSGRQPEQQVAGARVESSEDKENPLDFTLWKAAKPGEPHWPSPWGEGRPGWHTECVVLSQAFLGDRRDIHAGGNDLMFPHHENEIAQAEALGQTPFFRFWLHNGMLSIGGEKMAKSSGNFEYAKDVLSRYDVETVRHFYLSRHYRKPLEYTEEGLISSQTAVRRLRGLLADIDAERGGDDATTVGEAGEAFAASLDRYRARFVDCMEEDLNTVAALGVLQELAAETHRFRASAASQDRPAQQKAATLLRAMGEPLGLFLSEGKPEGGGLESPLIEMLLELRDELRQKREFALSDQIRDRLTELGIVLKDTAHGTTWTYR